jgi:hypothetical protein
MKSVIDLNVLINRALRKERSMSKGKRAIAIKAELEAPETPLPKLSGTPEQISIARARALRVPESDMTPNVMGDLYHDAVARGLVDGVPPVKVTQSEVESYMEERCQRSRNARQMANIIKWSKTLSWAHDDIFEGGDREDYSDLAPDEDEDV